MSTRTYPHSDDAEAWILGACLRDGSLVPALMDILPAEAMYSKQKESVLLAMYEIASRGSYVDVVTVFDHLSRRGDLGVALPRGEVMLMDWADNVPSTAGLKSHARIVLEHWIARQTIQLTRRLHEQSWNVATDFPAALSLMRSLALDLVDKSKRLDRLLASEAIR